MPAPWLPPLCQQLLHAHRIQHRGTGFPIGVFHLAVFDVEGIASGGGTIDELAGGLLIV